ncbi:MAG: hypothetical protein U0165_10530 [Polyangiaceae bacterium]
MWTAPGALAAVFVDVDGECVDLAGRGKEFDLKVAAAHWRILLHDLGHAWLREDEAGVCRGEGAGALSAR